MRQIVDKVLSASAIFPVIGLMTGTALGQVDGQSAAGADSEPANTGDKCIGAGGGSSSAEGTSRSSQSSSRSTKRRGLIPIVIIDKSDLFRAGLVHILGGSRFRVTASCSSLSDLSERVLGDKHRVVLIRA